VGEALAPAIVVHRETNGPFRNRAALKDVPRLGAKAFELSAGFLRVNHGDQPLDRSGVHPEAYPVVRRILDRLGADIFAVIGNSRMLQGLKPADFADDRFGVPTVADILKELEKPGRDPRPVFKTAAFREEVESIADLKPGMVLEGVVTNVAAFGAFVDVGVHQDGLVHVSAMSNSFVKDPRAVAKPGDVVKVKVLSVDVTRKRIALTMRLGDAQDASDASRGGRGGDAKAMRAVNAEANRPAQARGALADALRRAAEKGAKP
jgi:protein Tex